MGDQLGLTLDHPFQQGVVRLLGVLRVWIVTFDNIVGQYLQVFIIFASGKPLKRTDPYVRSRDTSEYSARL